VESQAALHLVTPLDFVSTCDIGGGDAGSPTVNRAGELVGVIFDGNLESLPNTYLYVEEQARAVHVAVQGIAEALEKVYHAGPLLGELGVEAGGGL
jgi:Peptidase S46